MGSVSLHVRTKNDHQKINTAKPQILRTPPHPSDPSPATPPSLTTLATPPSLTTLATPPSLTTLATPPFTSSAPWPSPSPSISSVAASPRLPPLTRRRGIPARRLAPLRHRARRRSFQALPDAPLFELPPPVRPLVFCLHLH